MAKAPAKPPAKPRAFPTLALETVLIQQVGGPVCGVDEAGRGPWAGPVSKRTVGQGSAHCGPSISRASPRKDASSSVSTSEAAIASPFRIAPPPRVAT